MNTQETTNESPDDRDVRFLVDGMLGSIARKLRIIGYDTIYDSSSQDKTLLRIAEKTGRYLVTSDMELYLSAKRLKLDSILVSSKSERNRLFEVLSKAGIKRINILRSPRCAVCNGRLKHSSKRDNDRTIYICEDCGKDYWKGGHWKKMTLFFHQVDLMLRRAAEKDVL